MFDILNLIIYSITIGVVIIILLYAIGSRTQFRVTLAQKQQMSDGSELMTFLLPKNMKKLQLKIGQQIVIKYYLTPKFMKTKSSTKGKQFTPIQNSTGSFKILLTNSSTDQDKILKQLKQLQKGQQVFVSIAKNNFQYVGGSVIKLVDSQKKVSTKAYKNIYILAQGNKIPIAFQIAKGICQQKPSSQTAAKPKLTILFVGGEIGDFALKNQFQQLQQNYDNIKYFYSLPVKGERQPSIAGLGISSEKVSESFQGDNQNTFCVLCAEEMELCVTVQRALMNKGVPASQIYKY